MDKGRSRLFLDLPPDLVADIKIAAVRMGLTPSRYVAKVMRERLSLPEGEQQAPEPPVQTIEELLAGYYYES